MSDETYRKCLLVFIGVCAGFVTGWLVRTYVAHSVEEDFKKWEAEQWWSKPTAQPSTALGIWGTTTTGLDDQFYDFMTTETNWVFTTPTGNLDTGVPAVEGVEVRVCYHWAKGMWTAAIKNTANPMNPWTHTYEEDAKK